MRMLRAFKSLLGAALCGAALLARADGPAYPESPRRPVTDAFHGVSVTENYRWLEDLQSPAVQSWVAQQNALTRATIDKLPTRPGIEQELVELIGKAPVTRREFQYAAGKLFAMKKQPPANQPRLIVLTDPLDTATEKLVVDPNRLNAKGTTTIDWYVASLDGKTVAVSLSDNGSEEGTLHLFDVASGRKLPDTVPRVQSATAGGSVAWAPGNRGLFYTRYPQGSERAPEDANFYQQVWFHQLGTPASKDRYVVGKDFPRIAEIALSATEDGRYTLADVANGDGGDHAFWLRGPAGRWQRIADFDDGVRNLVLGRDQRWYALVLKGSPRGRIVAAPLAQPALAKARLVVAESDKTIAALTPARSRLYVEYLAGGPQELHAFSLQGEPLERIGDADIATVVVGTALRGDALLFGSESFVKPFAWYRYGPSPREPRPKPLKTALSEEPTNVRLDDMVVVREFATSKDGTPVPLNIVYRQGSPLDGTAPALLTAYGGYGVSMQPRFSPRTAFWLRHGGVYVLANTRGGGEFGEDWRRAGNLVNKQNVFDDFIAAAQHLVRRGYTAPARLAIEGGSNGGLLMGAALVQRPDLFKAVVSHVGMYDMLRFELSPNGAFNATEFGSVKDPAQFKALYAYSPYHHVVDGGVYPAVMLLTGINDGRVEPHHSLKMAARLQAASVSGKPVLLRVAGDAGHGQGMALSSQIELDADVFAFLFDQLNIK
ncbi:MAG TPA: prolyl oligopeptidase family serine peptidase [Albitalea sp.]|nr:prolyl oligopeptidase family serine peptidase [Albitalea sp.]